MPYATDDKCGTLAGVKRHYYRKTVVCVPCRLAERAYQADTRRRYAAAKWRRAVPSR
jgi:hypothetical protein